jgi:hypothetical protein
LRGGCEEPERPAALCRYALKLTVEPWAVSEDDLAPLRDLGLSDRTSSTPSQVVSCFNYVNRVADGSASSWSRAGLRKRGRQGDTGQVTSSARR